MKRNMSWTLLLILLASIVLTACGGESKKAEHDTQHAPNGDLQEKTASVKVLPAFLANQKEEIRTIYQLAGENKELLEWMPCYCGCGESAGHKSNQNCFIRETGSDGSIVWDDHGTRCGICLEIALKSVAMKKQGKSTLEIRKAIDEAYKTGAGKPTDTPMPQA
ncbi:PCYCGC motif-containing (lipo)protein [Paenibacillus lutrae]|uniref:Lipoprotein n=1 Tax=Paenibacillus lutrae TaxID=2078573 RepID=A0A7X3FHX9_9BACL|nr:PCYCGC motif-containing (lipo)protein [Paenibacillus lutrae]MVP00119.1 hypothetical protein [Paenibacillus lutrae]